MEEVEEAALLPATPTLRSGKLDRPVQYRFFRRSNFLALRDSVPYTTRTDLDIEQATHVRACQPAARHEVAMIGHIVNPKVG
jgi:hypothetical protein